MHSVWKTIFSIFFSPETVLYPGFPLSITLSSGDNSVFLLTFPNGGEQSPSTKPHTHNPPSSGVQVTLLLSPQPHPTSSGHREYSPLRASPTLRNLLGLLDVCRREAAGLPWLEARAFRGSLLGQSMDLFPYISVFRRTHPCRNCIFQADPQKNLLCILPAPKPPVHAPYHGLPHRSAAEVSEAGGQTGLGSHSGLPSVLYN